MLIPGSIVGGFRIEGQLGRGGMGVVYEATQIALQRRVALKVIAFDFDDDPISLERFRGEAILQASLDHRNIVPIYEAAESEHGLFIAMRLVRGENLKQRIVRGPLDGAEAVTILRQVAAALDAAHENGLIHRDVKPENILVESIDRVFLADFGLAKLRGRLGFTRSGVQPGSIDYISPEQLKNLEPTGASDIYALGVVCYECLSGLVPYPKDSEAAVLLAKISEDPEPLSSMRSDLAAGVGAVVQRAMARDPEGRYATATEFVYALERALAQPVTTAPAPPAPPRRRSETLVDPPTIRDRPPVAKRVEDISPTPLSEPELEPTHEAAPAASPEPRTGTVLDIPVARPAAPVPVTPPAPPRRPETLVELPTVEDPPPPVKRVEVAPAEGVQATPASPDNAPDIASEAQTEAVVAIPAAKPTALTPVVRIPSRWRTASAVAGFIVAAVAAAGAGFVVGHGSTRAKAIPLTTAQTADIAISYPAGLTRQASTSDRILLVGTGGSRSTIVVLFESRSEAGDLPSGIRRPYSVAEFPTRTILVNGGRAVRYNKRSADWTPIFAVFTPTSVAAVICSRLTPDRECTQVAGSVRILRDFVDTPYSDTRLRQYLVSALKPLYSSRRKLLTIYITARSRKAQAATADALASAYRSAISSAVIGTRDAMDLDASLGRSERAYLGLASAIRSARTSDVGFPRVYAAAIREVGLAEKALAARIRSVSQHPIT